MTIYWTSTKAPTHLFRRDYESPETAAYVSENIAVDPSVLAADLGICARTIRSYQRRLGVRALAENNPAPKQMWGGRCRGTTSALVKA